MSYASRLWGSLALALGFTGLLILIACESEGYAPSSKGVANDAALESATAGGRNAYSRSLRASPATSPKGLSDSMSGVPQRETRGELIQRLSPDEEIWIVEDSLFRRQADDRVTCGTCFGIDEAQREIPMPLRLTSVKADITDFVATVDLKQCYQNPFRNKIDVKYLFPLPVDAAVSEFVMTVGQRRIRGIVRKKEEAERIYREARNAGLVAALLTQERPNVFEQKIANIESGQPIDVELRYFQSLPYRDGAFEFVFPMVVGPRFNPAGTTNPIRSVSRGQFVAAGETAASYLAPGERTAHRVEIDLTIQSGVSIEEVASETHATRLDWENASRARVRLSPSDDLPNRDFVLRYKVAGQQPKSGLMVQNHRDGQFFTMMIVPPADLARVARQPVELVFVVDCSGSMRGLPLQKAKAAIRRALRQSNSSDTFQIIRFSENASSLGPEPLPATSKNIRRGLAFLDGLDSGGGTQMIEGIRAALDPPTARGRRRVVSFMTDGFIGNEDFIFREVYQRVKDARIFSFGIGSSVNRHLIEGLARIGRGAAAYVALDGDSGRAVDAFYDCVRHPALEDLKVDWKGAEVVDVFPRYLPDLFVGRPITVVGRFKGSAPRSIGIEGRQEGQRRRLEVPMHRASGTNSDLSKIWARRKLASLDYAKALGDGWADSEALSLALEFGLVSQRTSFIAVDASRRTSGHPGGTVVPVSVPVPEGVDSKGAGIPSRGSHRREGR